CQNNVIYINGSRSFFRIPVFEAICYSFFLASVDITIYSPNYNVFINGPPGNTATNAKEIRDYLMDFYTGKRVDYTLDNLEELLKKDEAIYKEFMALSRKKKKELATRFIRKYKQKTPRLFPQN
ncbi:MAG: hypothetical protein IPJ32_15530, partial [Sphingobacteriaceae bacterium]|nr:hypothetical protein [Sphingobacteriaceae bacterium]